MNLQVKRLTPAIIGFAVPLLLVGLFVVGGIIATRSATGMSGGPHRYAPVNAIGGSASVQLIGNSQASTNPNPAAQLLTPVASATQMPAPANEQPAAGGHASILPWAFGISSEFGHYPNGGAHYGLDLNAPAGIIQTAPVGGVVEDVLRGCVEGNAACGKGWGNHVWWKSDETGHHILLAHFSRLDDAIQVGAHITAGQTIGVTGATGYATGPHTHVQVNTDQCCENPSAINPAIEFPWLACGPTVLGGRFGGVCDPGAQP